MKTLYTNGTVYTGTFPLCEAFVVEDDKFLFAGSQREACLAAGKDAGVVDLKGRFVCAAFNDSHMHLLSYGNALGTVQMAQHTQSLAQLLQCMRDFLAKHTVRDGDWLVGRGWNHDYFTDVHRMPNRYDLDQVSTEIPIVAVRACGHCLTVNSKALDLLGVSAETKAPEGGRIGSLDGVPDGRFYDNAMPLVMDRVPAPDKEGIKDMIRSACRALNSYGVTSSQTDDYIVFPQVPWNVVNDAYSELEASGELTVRVYEQCNFQNLADLQEFVEAGNGTGVGSDLFRLGPLKMLGDGSLGARTAFLSRPYADDPATRGIPIFTQQAFDEMIGYANAHGMQVAVHTIGDGCLDRVLTAIERALAQCPREDHRHGIVHCQITRPEQLDKIAKLHLHVYAQSIFLDYDSHIVRDRVGEALAATSYSWKTLMRNGVSVSNGSDCPVELPDVMAGIQCAVTRQTLRKDVPAYLPEQAFTVQEALDSYTIRGAQSSFDEKKKGQIKPGMLADFVVLGENPFRVAADRIKEIPVCATYLGGRKVYERS